VFKKLRILILLLILASVALGSWQAKTRAAEWKYPLTVVIYPINGDGSRASAAYIANLTKNDFQAIEDFIQEEFGRYDLKTVYGAPVVVDIAAEVNSNPPQPPEDGNVLKIIFWSLRLRYWASRHDDYNGAAPQIRMFVRYFDPKTTQTAAHSLGLQKGMLGVVNAFAHSSLTATNNVVIAHEMLHTVGATDKYDPDTNLPVYPDGYAEPELNPRHPQHFAELMGGRIPLSEAQAEMPRSLEQALIGERTAREINWIH
jgi:hypothetical protein